MLPYFTGGKQMNKSRKLYAKALKYYNNGNVDKASVLCDKSIALDMYTPAMNLRGLIYYIKGELESAEIVWKINSSANNDNISKKYIEDVESDNKRAELFKEGVKYYDDINIPKALELFLKCSESDFNSINVNNYLSSCYIKLGDYNNALKHIGKVSIFDEKNIIATSNKRIIEEFGGLEEKESNRFIIYAASAAAVLILGMIFYNIISKELGQSFKVQSTKSDYNIVAAKNSDIMKSKKNSNKNNVNVIKTVPVFPVEDIQNNINNNNFDMLYEEIRAWKDKNLDTNDSLILKRAVGVLEDKGVRDFYIKGCNFKSDGDCASAIKYLSKAYEYGKSNYLYQHILYMLADAKEKTSDAAGALKYYEEYDSLYYPKGEYEPTVLYNMAMIYKDLDAAKAENYAGRLNKSFADSIYNNENIKSILGQ